jgi:hypothetical protein
MADRTADRTATNRVKRQRDARLYEGWQEVRIWVPTDEDAEDVRKLAAERRAKAEALHGLREGITSMSIDAAERIIDAIISQGSPAYTTPSGPVLTLLSDLAGEGELASFSRAFIIFARAKPANAAFVANAAPSKILNQYLLGYLNIDPGTFIQWEKDNPDWSVTIKDALRDPDRLERVVGGVATSIRQAMQKPH